MQVENVPQIYMLGNAADQDLFVYDFKMTEDVVKTRVNLSMNMFSFLQVGRKQVHFDCGAVAVNNAQSLLIRQGNCLWTELLDNDAIYFCKLFFFSDAKLQEFLVKYPLKPNTEKDDAPYFVIENDAYISAFLSALSSIMEAPSAFKAHLLALKFEEIMLYLAGKYGDRFTGYLRACVAKPVHSFKAVLEQHIYSNLKLEEIAFLCNMSLSTFKRHFAASYEGNPGKWLQDKRLQRAKELLELGEKRASDIYLDFGYNNLSNFSAAFKKKFGKSPRGV